MTPGKLIMVAAVAGLAAATIWLFLTVTGEDQAAEIHDRRPRATHRPTATTGPANATPTARRQPVTASPLGEPADTDERSQGPTARVYDAAFDPDDPSLTGEARYEREIWVKAAHYRYDQRDYEGVLELGNQLLAELPSDPQILRLVVLSACALGDGDLAREHVSRLAQPGRSQVLQQCRQSGLDIAAGR